MRPNDHAERFTKDASIGTNEAVDEEVLDKMHQAYERSARPSVPPRRPDYWALVFESRIARLAAAALILLAALTVVGQLGGFLTGGSVAWADVTQRFQSVPFVYASIYVKKDALAEPRQFELWMGQGGYARVRVGSQVVFGRDGEVTRAFDIRDRGEVEADCTAADIVRMLATPGEFSLETVIRSISGGKLVDVTPAMNADAAIGEDLAVFDAHSAISPGWVRIYALRESRLPVGLRIWDPAEGFGVDALITYAKEQPRVFFDPDAFGERLRQSGDAAVTLAYLFLKDPGGQEITPGDLLTQGK